MNGFILARKAATSRIPDLEDALLNIATKMRDAARQRQSDINFIKFALRKLDLETRDEALRCLSNII